jgi:4-hydroxybenzoate polyprenyltransferase
MPANARSSSRLLAYLQLFRLPNVFTAMADIAMGFWFTHAAVVGIDRLVFALLLTASSCLYTAGMVLNDVYDLEIDRAERPKRPLPSGRIDAKFAGRIGTALMIAGLVAALVAVLLNRGEGFSQQWMQFRPVICAIGLAGLVLLYDRILKHTPFGPVSMGGCRALNVLLGMSASPEPWTLLNFLIAAGLGIYIAGVTWFARTEATISKRAQLIGALIVILAGLEILWHWPFLIKPTELFETIQHRLEHWTYLWIVIVAILGWRFCRAIAAPLPRNVQAAIKGGILGVIILDAVTVSAVRGPVPGIAIFLLIVPTVALGAWVYST